ncbi:FHA domain-containing protein [Planctomycetota bacterium]
MARSPETSDAKLVFRSGKRKGETFGFGEADNVVVGSGDEATLRLVDSHLSPQQFQIKHAAGHYYLFPLAEDPRIFLNGREVRGRSLLDNGYVISAGGTELAFFRSKGGSEPVMDPEKTPVLVPSKSHPDTRPRPSLFRRKKQEAKSAGPRFGRIPKGAPKSPKAQSQAIQPASRANWRKLSRPETAAAGDQQVLQSPTAPAAPTGDSLGFAGHRSQLQVVRGPMTGRVFPLHTAKTCMIGRSYDVDIALIDHTVERRHCRLNWEDAALWAEDLGTQNRTFVNDEPIERRRLRVGDVIRLGQSELRVCEAPADPAATPAATPAADPAATPAAAPAADPAATPVPPPSPGSAAPDTSARPPAAPAGPAAAYARTLTSIHRLRLLLRDLDPLLAEIEQGLGELGTHALPPSNPQG